MQKSNGILKRCQVPMVNVGSLGRLILRGGFERAHDLRAVAKKINQTVPVVLRQRGLWSVPTLSKRAPVHVLQFPSVCTALA